MQQASTAAQHVDKLLLVLQGMHDARRACEPLTLPAHPRVEQAKGVTDDFEQFSGRFHYTKTDESPLPYLEALQDTTKQLAFAVNQDTRAFIHDCLKLLSPTRSALEEACKIGWPREDLYKFMDGPQKTVHRMSFKLSRDGRLRLVDLQTLLDLIQEAQKLREKIQSHDMTLAKKRRTAKDVGSRIALLTFQLDAAVEVLEKASLNSSEAWERERSCHDKAQAKLAEAREKAGLLDALISPEQADWTEFDEVTEATKKIFAQVSSLIFRIKRDPLLHLANVGSYKEGGRALRVRGMLVRDPEVAYWWRKLRAVADAFEKFITQPEPKWPLPPKVWSVQDQLDRMERTIRAAAHDDTHARDMLPEVMVFRNIAFLKPFLLPRE
ncbi:MAG TPA: hypothetical protein VFO38_03780 [Candidatus Saccharimonadales bacterium]|nr:hypothetical protein [Candidatus Saccharimonadales bacterium]